MDESLKALTALLNLPLLAMVMARIGGLVAFAPFFGSASIPVQIRALLTGVISLFVLPFLDPSAIVIPNQPAVLIAAVVSELMIGLVFGFAILALFSALELAGLMIGQQMGIAMAQVFDPLFNEETSVLGQLFFWLATIIFLVIGGHHALLGAVIKSFATLPAGSFMIGEDGLVLLSGIVQVAFVVAIQVSAPVIVTIFLATLALGFVARTVPQLNILSVGFPLRAVMGFLLTVVSLGAGIDIFMRMFDDVFLKVHRLFGF